MKRWAKGVFHGLRKPHLQRYLDEFVFRWNRRRHMRGAFDTLLGIGVDLAPATYRDFVDGVCQDSCRLHPFSRCAIFGPGHGAAAASFMGERVGGPMASAPGFGSLWIEPDRADGLPVARPT